MNSGNGPVRSLVILLWISEKNCRVDGEKCVISVTICVASFWTEPCFRKSYDSYEDLRKIP